MDSHFKKLYKNIGSYVNKKSQSVEDGKHVFVVLSFDDDYNTSLSLYTCTNVLEKRKNCRIFTTKTQRKIANLLFKQYTYEGLSHISRIDIVI